MKDKKVNIKIEIKNGQNTEGVGIQINVMLSTGHVNMYHFISPFKTAKFDIIIWLIM